MSDSLFVVGAGWYALEIAGWAEECGFPIAGLVELLDPARVGTEHGGHRIVDGATLPEGARAIIAGSGDRQHQWRHAVPPGTLAATVVHPRAHISATATIAEGAIVGPMAVVGAGTTIGPHAIVSRGALVGHHSTLGAFVQLLPGANVAGHVEIGDETTVGMSAAIAHHVKVGERATIAAAAMVLRDVAAGTRVQGVPAREYGG